MTDTAHPSIDVIADHQEELLAADRAAAVSAHLAACADCRAIRASLEGVAAVLASDGAAAEPIPASVAGSLDEAVRRASVERAAGVPSLAERRTTADAAHPSRRPRLLWLAGAAAAVVIAGAVGMTLDLGSDVDSSAGGDGSSLETASGAGRGEAQESADAAVPQGDAEESTTPPGPNPVTTVAPPAVASLAEDLVAGRVAVARGPGECAAGEIRDGDAVVSAIRFRGELALLVVDDDARRATVLDCATASRVLYETGY